MVLWYLTLISAAIRRGLIEARVASAPARPVMMISAAIRRGLIEAASPEPSTLSPTKDFRGHSPRPH